MTYDEFIFIVKMLGFTAVNSKQERVLRIQGKSCYLWLPKEGNKTPFYVKFYGTSLSAYYKGHHTTWWDDPVKLVSMIQTELALL